MSKTTKTYEKADHSALVDQLTEGIKSMTNSAEWTRYLDFQARFHHYSAANVQLILMQNPYATQVAGFHTWKSVGRFPAKGTGIYIRRPSFRKVENQATDEDEKVLTGFGWVAVFDVADTTGDELPEVAKRLTGAGDDELFARLVEAAKGIGFEVIDHEFEGGTNGDCSHEHKTIRVESRNAGAQRIKTLAHELAHAYLHAPETTNYRDERGLCELEAESTAYVVCQALGLDTSDYSFGYVAGWAGGDKAVEIIQAVTERIQKTADKIIKAVEGAESVETEVVA